LVVGAPCIRQTAHREKFCRVHRKRRRTAWLVVTQELEQHIDHAEHGAGRFALGVGERRKSVESPIEIRRAVDEYEVDLIHDGFLIKAGRWLNTVRLINE